MWLAFTKPTSDPTDHPVVLQPLRRRNTTLLIGTVQPMTAEEIIQALGLLPHPEGGHYAETWRGPDGPDGRSLGTAIHFLLAAGERSHWHRVDATEIWHFHSGDPLTLQIADGQGRAEHTVGPNLPVGQRPQVVIPPHAWQSAATTGEWTLVSCTVSPGFEFDGFELAPPGWEPE